MVIEADEVRCPSCRGIKQVAGLGGIIGDCKLCKATGKIKASELPAVAVIEPVLPVNAIIDSVSNCLPVSVNEPLSDSNKTNELSQDFVKSGKRAIYKRKQA